ncbi:ankyrin [Lepidopterella palustris CBS 459.81]|uniref:Ankyrin n=1 Tax=Lepidopterella palustris CBS 459.81 TaxID=1314670 RepID=A0A8E2JHU5_9PEZI|nr:ankyrin [Lepidopterella palustris CBS 459.81]
MDSIAIAAGSAQLLSAIIKIQGMTYTSGAGYFSRDPSIQNLETELTFLRSIFQGLEETALSFGQTKKIDKQIDDLLFAFEQCDSSLHTLSSHLWTSSSPQRWSSDRGWYPQRPNKKAAFRRSWPLSRVQTMELIFQFQAARRKIVSFLSSGQLGASPILPTPASTDIETPRSEDAIQKRRKDALEWLSTLNYYESHNDARDKRVAGTCRWVFHQESFQRWSSTLPGSSDDVLFSMGMPGSGKTILTSQVIDHLEGLVSDQKSKKAVAYYYFNYQSWTPISLMLTTLLKQLARRQASIPEPVLQMWKLHKSGGLPALKDIIATFLATCGHFDVTFIVLDALDECSDQNWRDLLQVLRALRSSFTCKLFLSFRNDREDRLKTMEEVFQNALRVEVKANPEDLELYVRSTIAQFPWEGEEGGQSLSDHQGLEDRICVQIVNSAKGSFLLPVMQVQKILDQTTRSEVESLLWKLPQELDTIYQDIFDEIAELPKRQCNLARKVLMWLFDCKRPLTVSELRHALAIDNGNDVPEEKNIPSLRTIEAVCRGMAAVDKSRKRINLSHGTFQAFIKSFQDSYFPALKETVARACCRYLLYEEFGKGPCLTRGNLESRLDKYDFLPYLCRYWGFHCRDSWRGEVIDLSMRILRDQSRLDALSQVFFTTRSQQRFTEKWATTPNGVSGLHIAAHFGMIGAVDKLLEASPDTVSAVDSWQRTPLHMVADNGQFLVAQTLIKKHASLGARDRDGKTPLHYAAVNGYKEIVQLLLNEKVDIMLALDKEDQSALDVAAGSGQVEVVEQLLDSGNQQLGLSAQSALQIAAAKGQAKVVGALLDRGAEADSKALQSAAYSGLEESVDMLLANGADPNARGEEGNTALHTAATAGHTGIVRRLLESGADISAKGVKDKTPLFLAVERGDERMVRQLLNEGAGIESRSSQGETALLHAAAGGQLDIVKILLDYSADPNSRRRGVTIEESDSPCGSYDFPLQAAAGEGHVEIVETLLDNGASINDINREGRTALHSAAVSGQSATVQLLLDRACEPGLRDFDGRTALHLAAQQGYANVVRHLLDISNVDSNASDRGKRTPLSFACEYRHADVVELLLRVIDDAEQGDNSKRTPLSYAAAAGSEAIVRTLLKREEVALDSLDERGMSPKAYAALNGHENIVQLLEYGISA